MSVRPQSLPQLHPQCRWCGCPVFDTRDTRDYPLEVSTRKIHHCAGLDAAVAARRRGEVQNTPGLRFAPRGGM